MGPRPSAPDSEETRFDPRPTLVATELALTYRIGDKIGTMLFVAPTM